MATTAVARTADQLTMSRLPLAGLLVIVIASARLALAAGILILCWITDTLDGILARRVPGMTKLGAWDPIFDGMMAMGLMAGMVLGGYVPVVWLAPALVLGGLLLRVRSLASGMLLQGMAYAWFLWTLAAEDRAALNLVLFAIGVAAITHGHRIPRVLLPRFFGDVARLRVEDHSPAMQRGSSRGSR